MTAAVAMTAAHSSNTGRHDMTCAQQRHYCPEGCGSSSSSSALHMAARTPTHSERHTMVLVMHSAIVICFLTQPRVCPPSPFMAAAADAAAVAVAHSVCQPQPPFTKRDIPWCSTHRAVRHRFVTLPRVCLPFATTCLCAICNCSNCHVQP